MKKTIFKSIIFASSFLMMLITTSCNEPSLIGSGVVDPDRADVVFTDTLTIFASTVKEDSVRTYNSLNLLRTYLCGNFNDPVFGNHKSEINTELRLSGTPDTLIWAKVATNEILLDSAFFILQYDTASFFGDINTDQDVSVYLLDDDMDNNATYYSNDNFKASQLLVTENINPAVFDTTLSILDSNGDTIRPPQLRLRLDVNHPLFTDYLWNGNSRQYYENDTFLLKVLKGVKIKMDDAAPVNLMTAFNLSSTIGGLYLFYKKDTTNVAYRFRVNSNAAQMVSFDMDYTNSVVEPFIGDENKGKDLVFIQGMSGLNAKFRIPYARNLQNAIVNQAQLEFTIATMLPEDASIFYDDAISQLLISKKNSDEEFEVIADLDAALGGDISSIFGGNIETVNKNNMVLRKYTMNISQHLQDMINGVETSDEIFITALSKAQTAQRSIIFGSEHPDYPIKLNVTYTINQ